MWRGQPVTSIESRYVETMALAEWRRLRLLCLEKEQITIETRRQEAADLSSLSDEAEGDTEVSPIRYTALAFRAMSDESRAQELLNRYETRCSREFQRALHCVKNHQTEKRRQRQEAAKARDEQFCEKALAKSVQISKRSEPNLGKIR